MSNNLEIFPSFEAAQHQTDNQIEASPKEEKMIEYIRELQEIEDQMEPLKEMKRDLKAQFKEAGWLTGDEISMTVRAYRMMKSKDFDFDEFAKVYESLAKITGR
jgi:predicted transcriptional regulator